jgi:hypothetical protein
MQGGEIAKSSENRIAKPRVSTLDLNRIRKSIILPAIVPNQESKAKESSIYNKFIKSYETELDSTLGFNKYLKEVLKHKLERIEHTLKEEVPTSEENNAGRFRNRRQSQLALIEKKEEGKAPEKEGNNSSRMSTILNATDRRRLTKSIDEFQSMKDLPSYEKQPIATLTGDPEEVQKSRAYWKNSQQKIFSALSKMNSKLKIQRPSKTELFYRNNIKDFENTDTFINAKDFIKQSNPLSLTLHDSNKYVRTLDALRKVKDLSRDYFSKIRKSRTVEGANETPNHKKVIKK